METQRKEIDKLIDGTVVYDVWQKGYENEEHWAEAEGWKDMGKSSNSSDEISINVPVEISEEEVWLEMERRQPELFDHVTEDYGDGFYVSYYFALDAQKAEHLANKIVNEHIVYSFQTMKDIGNTHEKVRNYINDNAASIVIESGDDLVEKVFENMVDNHDAATVEHSDTGQRFILTDSEDDLRDSIKLSIDNFFSEEDFDVYNEEVA